MQAGGGLGWGWQCRQEEDQGGQGRQEEDGVGDGRAGRRRTGMGMAVQAGGRAGWEWQCRQEEDQVGDRSAGRRRTKVGTRAGRRRTGVVMAVQAGGGAGWGWQCRQEEDQPPPLRAAWWDWLFLARHRRCPARGRQRGRCLKFAASSRSPFPSKPVPSSLPSFPGPPELPPQLLAVGIP